MARIRLQSEKSLTDFFAPLRSVPSCRLVAWKSSTLVYGSDWAVADLGPLAPNMTFSKDDWQTQEGKLSMNASEFIYGSLHLFDPIINAEFFPAGRSTAPVHQPLGVSSERQETSSDGKTLILDDGNCRTGIYLAKNWQQLWSTTPGWLNSLQLKEI